MRFGFGFVALLCLLVTVSAAGGGGYVPQAFRGCNLNTLRNCRHHADNEMDQYYYAYTVPPPPNPIIPAGAVPPTDLIKFGRAQMERYFDNHGRYVDVRRRLEQLCGQLLLTGLNVQNPEDIAEFQTAVRMCVKYHFRMIASVRCRASGGCIDLLWRCGIQRINAINPPPFRINHNPIQNPATPWLRNGGSEFYQVLDAQGNVANADAGFDILHHALTQTLTPPPDNRAFQCTDVAWHNGYNELPAQRLRPTQVPAAFRNAYAAWLVRAGVAQAQVQQIIGAFVFTETASETKVDSQSEATTETEAETEVEAETEAKDQATAETEVETEEKTESKLTGMSKVDLSSKVGNALNALRDALQCLRQGTSVFEQRVVEEIVQETARVEPAMEEVAF